MYISYNNLNYQKKDVLIILGDAGINYFLNHFDDVVKEKLNKLGLIFFCINGNHEERAENSHEIRSKIRV